MIHVVLICKNLGKVFFRTMKHRIFELGVHQVDRGALLNTVFDVVAVLAGYCVAWANQLYAIVMLVAAQRLVVNAFKVLYLKVDLDFLHNLHIKGQSPGWVLFIDPFNCYVVMVGPCGGNIQRDFQYPNICLLFVPNMEVHSRVVLHPIALDLVVEFIFKFPCWMGCIGLQWKIEAAIVIEIHIDVGGLLQRILAL